MAMQIEKEKNEEIDLRASYAKQDYRAKYKEERTKCGKCAIFCIKSKYGALAAVAIDSVNIFQPFLIPLALTVWVH